jgi:type II secretory pathway component GspD/PulD (secretin)
VINCRLFFTISASVLFAIGAFAVEDPRDQNIPYLNLNNVDVRDAISSLFRNTEVSYSVDGSVQGSVTIRLENQPFESVLRNMLNQVNATYRVQDGLYEIIARKKPTPPSFAPPANAAEEVPAGENIRRIPINCADPALIVKLLSAGFTGDWKSGPEISLLTITAPSGGEGGLKLGFGDIKNRRAGIGLSGGFSD